VGVINLGIRIGSRKGSTTTKGSMTVGAFVRVNTLTRHASGEENTKKIKRRAWRAKIMHGKKQKGDTSRQKPN